MTKLPAVHELIYEEKAKKLLDFRIMEIHVQLIIKRKNILKESKIIWSFYKNSIQVKFRFSKKAKNFETISHLIWCLLLVNVKSSGRLFQIFAVFS